MPATTRWSPAIRGSTACSSSASRRPASTAGRSARRARRAARAARSTRPPAQAEAAGFRACFRCRPELAPGQCAGRCGRRARRRGDRSGSRRARSTSGSLDELAAELGVSARHLRRATRGAARRVAGRARAEPAARAREAAAAGHARCRSPRSRSRRASAACAGSTRCSPSGWARAPSELRRAHARAAGEGVTLRLDYPRAVRLDAHARRSCARARSPASRRVGDDRYRRVVHLDGKIGDDRRCGTRDRARARARRVSPALLPVADAARRARAADVRSRRAPRRDRARARPRHVLAPLVARGPGCACPARSIRSRPRCARCSGSRSRSPPRRRSPAGSPRSSARRYDAHDGLARRFPTPREVVAAGARCGSRKLGLPRHARGRDPRARGRARARHGRARRRARSRRVRRELVELARHRAVDRALPRDARAARARCVSRRRSRRAEGARHGSGAKAAEARAEAWRPFARTRCCTSGLISRRHHVITASR